MNIHSQKTILNGARHVRQVLQQTFPQTPCMQKQCKRASILFHLWCQNKGIVCRIVSGYVGNKEKSARHENGHVWNKVFVDDEWQVVDITLSQFEKKLGKEIPSVVFGPLQSIYALYLLHEDGLGDYPYRSEDVREDLKQKVLFPNDRVD